MLYYFSATGNSRALAEELGRLLCDKVADMVPLLHEGKAGTTLAAGETLGLVFPVYGWSLPNIVREFLYILKVGNPGGSYVWYAVTCGDDVGVADRPIRKAFALAGLEPKAGYSVNMPDSYVCLPGFDVDSDEERSRKLNAFAPRVREIADSIIGRRKITDIRRGSFAWIKTYVLGGLFRRYLITDKPFHATADCTRCGTCVTVCPMRNITLPHRPVWHGNCTGCLACYHHCPTRAIRYGRRTEKKGQYLFSRHAHETNKT